MTPIANGNSIKRSALGAVITVVSASALILIDEIAFSSREAASFAAIWSACQICAVGLGFGTARHSAGHRSRTSRRYTAVATVAAAVIIAGYTGLGTVWMPTVAQRVVIGLSATVLVVGSIRAESLKLQSQHVAGSLVLAAARLGAVSGAILISSGPASLRASGRGVGTTATAALASAALAMAITVAMGWLVGIRPPPTPRSRPQPTTGKARADLLRWLSFVSTGFASTLANFGPAVLLGAMDAEPTTVIAVFVLGRVGQIVSLPGVVVASRTAAEAVALARAPGDHARLDRLRRDLAAQVSLASLLAGAALVACPAVLWLLGVRVPAAPILALALLGFWAGVASGPAAQLILFWHSPWEVTVVDLASAGLMAIVIVLLAESSTGAIVLAIGLVVGVRNLALAVRAERLFRLRTVHPLPRAATFSWSAFR